VSAGIAIEETLWVGARQRHKLVWFDIRAIVTAMVIRTQVWAGTEATDAVSRLVGVDAANIAGAMLPADIGQSIFSYRGRVLRHSIRSSIPSLADFFP
jgi:hypothetical protein